MNHRSDRYGGSLANRIRLTIEVLEAIRAKVGDDFIVGIRMTGGEDVEGGLTEQDGLEIATTLARTGTLDFINLVPPAGIVTSRVVTSPGHMKRILAAIATNIARYEDAHGAIPEAEEPAPNVH